MTVGSIEQALLKAKSLIKKKLFAEAGVVYRDILERFPNNRHAREGLLQLASSSASQMSPGAEPRPEEIDRLIELFNREAFAAVLERGEFLRRQYPRSAFLSDILGAANARSGRREAAMACYQTLLQLRPGDAECLNKLGNLLKETGRPFEAIARYTEALAVSPEHSGISYNLALILGEIGRQADAIDAYRRVLALRPDFPEAHNNLGTTLAGLKRRQEAAACFAKAVQLKPDYAEAFNNFGVVLTELGRDEEAASCLQKAIALNPHYAEAHNNLGSLMKKRGRNEEAFSLFAAASRLKPGYAEAYYNLGSMHRIARRPIDAIKCYDQAIEARPDYAEARAEKYFQQASICDWDGIADSAETLAELGIEGDAVSPFTLLSLQDDPTRHKARAVRFAQEHYPAQVGAMFARPSSSPERLRIGYFSADFRDHATMHLLAKVFENHDRSRFDVYAYSFGKPVIDPMRARVETAIEHFREVSQLSDDEIASLARRDGIDIAVDLKGYTADFRGGIFASRAAPIQINYLGYPGSIGAPFLDYMIADEIVIPEAQKSHYSEKIIYLPDSYQANDDSKTIATLKISRTDERLPPDAFVFCCFNNNYKISLREFTIWMRVLQNTALSVLWLLGDNPEAEENIRKYARRCGVDPDRIIFAKRRPLSEHLARHRLADLFLDTFNVNAHTTASDALWAGLPVLTKIGNGFAARVAASLLNAVGLPELITTSEEHYEREASILAADRPKLERIRRRLQENRGAAPLFDTARFTRHLEDAYVQAYSLYLAGEDPRAFSVPARLSK